MSQKNKIKNSLPVQGRSKLLRGTTLIHRTPGGLLPLGSSCNGNGPARSSRAARKWRCAGLGQGALTASPLAWAAMAHGLPHRQISYRFFILSRIFPLSRVPGWKFSLGALPPSLQRPGSAVRCRALSALPLLPRGKGAVFRYSRPNAFWVSARASSMRESTSWMSCSEMTAAGSNRMVLALTRVPAVSTFRANMPLAHA